MRKDELNKHWLILFLTLYTIRTTSNEFSMVNCNNKGILQYLVNFYVVCSAFLVVHQFYIFIPC